MRIPTLVLALTCLIVMCLTGGCTQNKFTRVNYETLAVGMPAEEVRDILGNPKAEFSDTWTYINDMPFYKAEIKFKDGRVADMAWQDERQLDSHPDMKDMLDRKPGSSSTRVVQPVED